MNKIFTGKKSAKKPTPGLAMTYNIGNIDVTIPIISGDMPNCLPNTLICGKIGPKAENLKYFFIIDVCNVRYIKLLLTCHKEKIVSLHRQQLPVYTKSHLVEDSKYFLNKVSSEIHIFINFLYIKCSFILKNT
jgi:hypothetical protein